FAAGTPSSDTGPASYPALRTAASSVSIDTPSEVTWAFSVARLTDAPVTPGTFFNAFSTRPTQEAQVIPEIARDTVSLGMPYPAFPTAAESASTGSAGLARTVAFSV